MGLFIVLAITEILTLAVIKQYLYERSWLSYYFAITINAVLSIWIWTLWFHTVSFRGMPDDPAHAWSVMNLRGMMFAVVIPRILIIIFHYSGRLSRRSSGGYSRKLTASGFAVSSIIMLVFASSALIGRFNVRTENYTIAIEGLHPDLGGLRIVHISDLHLPCFYHHQDKLEEIMLKINGLEPDLLVNTGDFINAGWREFDRIVSNLSNSLHPAFMKSPVFTRRSGSSSLILSIISSSMSL